MLPASPRRELRLRSQGSKSWSKQGTAFVCASRATGSTRCEWSCALWSRERKKPDPPAASMNRGSPAEFVLLGVVHALLFVWRCACVHRCRPAGAPATGWPLASCGRLRAHSSFSFSGAPSARGRARGPDPPRGGGASPPSPCGGGSPGRPLLSLRSPPPLGRRGSLGPPPLADLK